MTWLRDNNTHSNKQSTVASPIEPVVSADLNKYFHLVDEFRKKILRLPEIVEKENSKVDFSQGRPQEIMIDVECLIETLADDFFLFAEEAEKMIRKSR